MNTTAELMEMIKSSKEPEGVIVHASDGRAFFLTKDDAKRTAIPHNGLYSAFQALQRQRHTPPKPPPTRDKKGNCEWAWAWLESHSPNSKKWRRICLTYFDSCL